MFGLMRRGQERLIPCAIRIWNGRARRPPPSPLVHDVAFLRRGYRPPPGAVRVRTDPMPWDTPLPAQA